MSEELIHDTEENKKNNETIIQRLVEDIEASDPDILKTVENKEQVVQAVLTQALSFQIEREEHHEGSLPAPRTLREYNEIIPNGAERIMKAFENQSSHRISLEKKLVGRQTFQSLLGQLFGFFIALIILGLGVYLIEKGHAVAGITLFGIDMVGLVAIFVVGRKAQKEKLNETSMIK